MLGLWLMLVAVCLLTLPCLAQDGKIVDDSIKYFKPGITVQEVLRERGYIAEVHYFISEDNYQIEMVRGCNPRLNNGRCGRANKLPIMFVHGIIMNSACWVVSSQGATPRLYDADFDFSTMNLDQLYEVVKDDPARKSLPLLAMNMGYEVWFYSRRGYTAGSRRKVNRPERTVVDALLEIPSTLFGAGFSLNGGLEPGRPGRVPISSFNYTAYNSSTLDQVRPTITEILSLLFSPQANLLQPAEILAKLPQILSDLGDQQQLFIDTFDSDFWDFTVDEQVLYDFPGAINTALNISGAPKLHIVSYSLGGAVSLLGLSHKPELAHKVSRHVSYQPALNLGSVMGIDYMLSYIELFAQSYIGPIPFLFQVKPLEALLQQLCSGGIAQRTYCEAVADSIVGFSAGQEAITAALLSVTPTATPGGELKSLAQYTRTDRPCMYRYNTVAQNIAKYGQRDPPCYDLGRIILRNMSIYSGKDDTVVAPNAVATTVSQIKVPVELNVIGDKKVHFNHLGNELHDNNDILILLPSFLDIERSNVIDTRARRSN